MGSLLVTKDDAGRVLVSSPNVSARMARQRQRETAPELALRRELHRRGLRFRVHYPLPGMSRRRADILFTRARVVVLVDGCFWHSCPQHASTPVSNAEWWRLKLQRNVARDQDTNDRLRAADWTVLRFWEHEDMVAAADAVEKAVRDQLA